MQQTSATKKRGGTFLPALKVGASCADQVPPQRGAPPPQPVDNTGIGFISVSTGSSTADTVLKWGFWIGLGLAAHRLYRVLRYDDPFIQWGGGTPAAWEMNARRSNAEREMLLDHWETRREDYPDLTDEEYEDAIIEFELKKKALRRGWHITKGARGFALWQLQVEVFGEPTGVREQLIKEMSDNLRWPVKDAARAFGASEKQVWQWLEEAGVPRRFKKLRKRRHYKKNPGADEFARVCSWCKRMRVGDRWVSDDPETDYITHGICPRCEQKVQQEIAQYQMQRRYEQPAPRRAPSWQPNPRWWEDFTAAEEEALKDELLDAYEPATNLSALARMFGVPVHIARQWLVESGKYIPSPMGGPRTITQLREAKERAEALHDRRQRPSNEEVLEARERLRAELIKEEMLKERERLKNELINAYQPRMNVRKLAKEKGVPYSTAMAWLKRAGVYEPPPPERSSEEFKREKFARFAIARPGEKVEDLADEFGIDRHTAFDWLHKEGVEIRAPEYIAKRQRGKWWKDSRSLEERELIDAAIALYKGGYSAKGISKKLKVSISKVQSWLKIEGIYKYENLMGGARLSKRIGALKAARTRRRRKKNPGADEFARVCSWCKRMFVEGEWVPGVPETKWVTHGLCEQCEEQVLREIDLMNDLEGLEKYQ